MKRLYDAARQLKKVEGQSAVARLLHESPQTLKNWEQRGISASGLLKAQQNIGCDAIWVRDGVGDMVKNFPLDIDTLKDAIAAAVEIDKKADLNLEPDKMAVLIAYWYDEFCEKGQHKPTLTEANRILRLVA